MIHFRNVSKYYDGYAVLKNVTFSIDKGEMVFVTGPTASGKTTLLKLICLAERCDEGSISIGGWEVDKLKKSSIPLLRQSIGFVFQDFRLLQSRTVFDNVAVAFRIRGSTEKDLKARVFDSLRMVNLLHKAYSYPDDLSGGEQQRVAIARAIAAEPTLILADEPTSNIDPDFSAEVIKMFKDINTKGTTVIVATHNRELFRNTGKRVLKLLNGKLVGEEIG